MNELIVEERNGGFFFIDESAEEYPTKFGIPDCTYDNVESITKQYGILRRLLNRQKWPKPVSEYIANRMEVLMDNLRDLMSK